MKALCFDSFGGPEVLRLRELPDPSPRPGHAIVRLAAIGLNFADIYRRRGSYHIAGSPPYVLGYEGAGVVESVSEDGSPALQPGDRVAFPDSPFANAELVSTSRTLSGGDLWNELTSAEERVTRSAELFERIRSGRLTIRIAARFPLAEGAEAHAYLEGRGAIGKVLLIP